MQLLRMSGVGMAHYWIARFLFDLCTYFVVVFILFGSLFLPFLSVYKYLKLYVCTHFNISHSKLHYYTLHNVVFLLSIVRRIERRGSKDDDYCITCAVRASAFGIHLQHIISL